MNRTATRVAAACLAAASGRALSALPTVAAAPPVSSGSSMLQAAFGLLVVLGLVFGLAWLARRFGLHRMGGSGAVRIVSSASLGGRERVVVVDVAGTWLVLGVTSAQVNALHVLPAQDLPAQPGAPDLRLAQATGAFAARLREALGRPGTR